MSEENITVAPDQIVEEDNPNEEVTPTKPSWKKRAIAALKMVGIVGATAGITGAIAGAATYATSKAIDQLADREDEKEIDVVVEDVIPEIEIVRADVMIPEIETTEVE